MDFYAVTLAFALVLAIAAAATALGRLAGLAIGVRTVRLTAALAFLVDLISAAQHWSVGHADGTPAELSAPAFFAAHVSYLVIGGLAAAALFLSAFTGKRREKTP